MRFRCINVVEACGRASSDSCLAGLRRKEDAQFTWESRSKRLVVTLEFVYGVLKIETPKTPSFMPTLDQTVDYLPIIYALPAIYGGNEPII